jgi:hypothetical protein
VLHTWHHLSLLGLQYGLLPLVLLLVEEVLLLTLRNLLLLSQRHLLLLLRVHVLLRSHCRQNRGSTPCRLLCLLCHLLGLLSWHASWLLSWRRGPTCLGP